MSIRSCGGRTEPPPAAGPASPASQQATGSINYHASKPLDTAQVVSVTVNGQTIPLGG